MPAALLEAAAEREFPVFEVPYELPFIAITEAAFTQLVNEQYAVLRRAIAAHERLERIVLSERGLEALAATLATLIGAAVLVFDARGEPLVQHAFRREIEPETLTALRERGARARPPARGPRVRALGGEEADRAWPCPSPPTGRRRTAVARRALPEAWLVAIKDAGPLSDFDRLTLHQAVTIVALELLRGRVAGDTERRLAGDVLAAVVARRARRARSGPPAGAVRAGRARGRDRGQAPGGERRGARRPARGRALRGAARRGGLRPGRLGRRSDVRAGAGAGRGGAVRARRAGDSSALAAELGGGLEVGVGPRGGGWRGAAELPRGAVCARGAGDGRRRPRRRNGSRRRARPARPVATYKDLGSFQLLLSLQDDEALKLFCDSILGPIEASEGHYGGELMRSLEAFIEENGQWERAARRLYCHRHTLRYRIRRVEELTGRDLCSARDRIEFWLALRGRESGAA